ncbi:hypothetical protein PCE1_003072 [Barthelona sp. PCE]
MPHVRPWVTENFIFTNFHEIVIISSTNEVFNNRKLHLIDIYKELVFQGPPVPPLYNDIVQSEKFDMLKPTLLEPTIFYRTMHLGTDRSITELFEFSEGEFIFVNQFDLPFSFEGFLLDKNYLVCQRKGNYKTVIEIVELRSSNIVFLKVCESEVVEFVEQYGCAYMVFGDHYSNIMLFSYTDEGVPQLIHDHPFQNVKIRALDRTPGYNRIVVEENEELCTCSVDENGVLSFHQEKYCFTKWNCRIEFINFLDIIIPHPRDRVHCHSTYCEYWDFVMLDNQVHCTVYDSVTGFTTFHRIFKRDMKCLFLLGIDTLPFLNINQRTSTSFRNFPLCFDWVNNSICLFHPSSAMEGSTLHSVHRFYDINSQKWCIGYVVEEEGDCIIIKPKKTVRFKNPKGIEYYNVSFNNKHHAITFKLRQGWFFKVNELSLNRNDIQSMTVVGNHVWFVIGFRIIAIYILDEETSVVNKEIEVEVGDMVVYLSPNPYCKDECFIGCHNRCFIAKYDREEEMLKKYEIVLNDSHNLCFIDQGMVVYGNKLYGFDEDGISNTWNIALEEEILQKKMISPNPGFVAWFEYINSFNLKMHTMTHNHDLTGLVIDSKNLNVIEFLANCNVDSVLSSFGSFCS